MDAFLAQATRILQCLALGGKKSLFWCLAAHLFFIAFVIFLSGRLVFASDKQASSVLLKTPLSSPSPAETAPQTYAHTRAINQQLKEKDESKKDAEPGWTALEPGLDFGEFRLNDQDARITILRIDPEHFDFFLGTSSGDQKPPRSLDQWSKEYDLIAAINASMYLPDNLTSTGYMRQGEHLNNKRIVERFGAFFVAGPRRSGLAKAAIIDKDMPNWRELIDDYDIVIQNYRMTNSERRILWTPGGPLYSISAIAQDGAGRLLFLHSKNPVEAYDFVQQVLHLPLDARTIIYVEGGSQAGMLLNAGDLKRDLAGKYPPSLLITGNLKALLPNVLGVRRKPGAEKPIK